MSIGFGEFQIELQDESLWRGDDRLQLTPRAFAVLQLLVRNAGVLVTKEQILEEVWEGTFVSDAVVKVAVREIRSVLGDDARSARYIQTVHRRGYRFVADLNEGSRAVEVTLPVPALEPLFGREGALDWLNQQLRQAEEGTARVAFVTGEAGIGKSALIESFCSGLSRDQSVLVAQGMSVEQYGEGEPYLPFLDCLGRLCRGPHAEAVTRVLRQFAPTWLTQLPWLIDEESRRDLAERTLGASAARMLREMADALEELSDRHVVLLVLDDLHWADAASVELLAYLGRARRNARILILGSFRPVDLVLADHPLRHVWQDLKLRRLANELPLAYLSQEEVSAIAADRLSDDTLADEMAAELHRRSDGNPLFVHTIIEYLQTTGALRLRDSSWLLNQPVERAVAVIPESLRLMVAKQIDQLEPAARFVLEGAAIIGFEFSSAAASQALRSELAGESASDIRSVAEVEEEFLHLARQQVLLEEMSEVILPDGSVTRRFRFKHVLHQTVLYEAIPSGVRSRRHLSAAQGAVAVYGESAGDIANELVVHFERAGMPAEAIRFLRRAAVKAGQRHANRERVELLAHALALAEKSPREQQAKLRLAVLPELIDARMSMADMKAAAGDCLQLVALADGLREVRAKVAALLLLASAQSWLSREDCLATLSQLEESCRLLPDGDVDRERARAFSSYWHLLWSGWRHQDFEACVSAVVLERQRSSRNLLCPLLARLSLFHALRSDYAESSSVARESRDLAVDLGAAPEYLLALFFEIWSALHAGYSRRARELIAVGADLASRNEHDLWRALFLLEEAWLELQLENLDIAEVRCRQGMELAYRSDLEYGKLLGEVICGSIEIAQGALEVGTARLEAATTKLESERVLMDWIIRMPLLSARLDADLQRGDLSAAADRCQELLALARDSGERSYMAFAHAGHVRVGLKEHDVPRARVALLEGLDCLEVESASWPAGVALVRVGREYLAEVGNSETDRLDDSKIGERLGRFEEAAETHRLSER